VGDNFRGQEMCLSIFVQLVKCMVVVVIGV